MPRKNRRNPEFFLPPEAPVTPSRGADTRGVGGQKEYRCPGCDHMVRAGIAHLVVVPSDDVDARRHWHTECWKRELRRLGLYRASTVE